MNDVIMGADTMITPKKEFDIIVYIGRFQPFHNAHKTTLMKAQAMADDVLVLVGSASASRSPKNPWTYQERRYMIQEDFEDIDVKPLNDFTYDNARWIAEVGEIVSKFKWEKCGPNDVKIGVIGHDKDHSTFYLNYFPQWKYIDVPAYPDHGETIDATKIRELLFRGDYNFIKGVVSKRVYNIIIDFSHTTEFDNLKRWRNDILAEKKKWAGSPYPPIFVTSDSIVVQSGHVLLVQRGGEQGYNLWAMPGGFIEENEYVRDASIRELDEETKLKVPNIILDKAISDKDTQIFDEPNRSLRGRTITHAFLYILDDTKKLPKVKGSDDAKDAKWVSFSDFEKMESQMFEDHYHIVKHMIGKV